MMSVTIGSSNYGNTSAADGAAAPQAALAAPAQLMLRDYESHPQQLVRLVGYRSPATAADPRSRESWDRLRMRQAALLSER